MIFTNRISFNFSGKIFSNMEMASTPPSYCVREAKPRVLCFRHLHLHLHLHLHTRKSNSVVVSDIFIHLQEAALRVNFLFLCNCICIFVFLYLYLHTQVVVSLGGIYIHLQKASPRVHFVKQHPQITIAHSCCLWNAKLKDKNHASHYR